MHKEHHVGVLVIMGQRLIVWAGLCSVCKVGLACSTADLLEGNDVGGGRSYFLQEATPPPSAEVWAANVQGQGVQRGRLGVTWVWMHIYRQC